MPYLEHINVSNTFEENIRDIIYNDLILSQEERINYDSIPFIKYIYENRNSTAILWHIRLI